MVITNLAGEITEAAVSNIYFARDGVVFTPGMESGLLGGITRRLLIDKVAPAAGVELRETALRPADIGRMQECFLSSSDEGRGAGGGGRCAALPGAAGFDGDATESRICEPCPRLCTDASGAESVAGGIAPGVSYGKWPWGRGWVLEGRGIGGAGRGSATEPAYCPRVEIYEAQTARRPPSSP